MYSFLESKMARWWSLVLKRMTVVREASVRLWRVVRSRHAIRQGRMNGQVSDWQGRRSEGIDRGRYETKPPSRLMVRGLSCGHFGAKEERRPMTSTTLTETRHQETAQGSGRARRVEDR